MTISDGACDTTFSQRLAGRFNGRDQFLGYTSTHAEDGRSTFVWEPTDAVENSGGMAHGGFIAAVIDDVAGSALASRLDLLTSIPTVDAHISYLRGVPVPGRYVCEGRILRVGRRISVVDGEILDADGQLLVRGTCTFAVRPAS